MGGNKSRTLPKKHTFIFLFKYSLVRRRWGVQGRCISSRTNKLMTGKFVLCLSANCCFYERLSPGRSKTYVTFDIVVVVNHCFTSLFGTKGLLSDNIIR